MRQTVDEFLQSKHRQNRINFLKKLIQIQEENEYSIAIHCDAKGKESPYLRLVEMRRDLAHAKAELSMLMEVN